MVRPWNGGYIFLWRAEIRPMHSRRRFESRFKQGILMTELGNMPSGADEDRRDFLKSCGKFAITVPPTMTVLLSTSLNSPAIARSAGSGSKGNNGVGNGLDPQPPGDPPVNDG